MLELQYSAVCFSNINIECFSNIDLAFSNSTLYLQQICVCRTKCVSNTLVFSPPLQSYFNKIKPNQFLLYRGHLAPRSQREVGPVPFQIQQEDPTAYKHLVSIIARDFSSFVIGNKYHPPPQQCPVTFEHHQVLSLIEDLVRKAPGP